MFETGNILLASHGTTGARAAEKMALVLCRPGGVLHQLTVVPDLWRGMMGDDWLNNASTRDTYGKYVEAQLGREIEQHRAILEQEAKARGVVLRTKVVVGKPAPCLIEYATQLDTDLVIIGSPRPRGTSGLRSRMQLEMLVQALTVPLLIAPYPR
ncbi:MAG: universal stress protein [Burkholderiales bacterium]